MTKEQETDRKLNWATLVAILSLAGGMLLWANRISERVASLEERHSARAALVQRIDTSHDADILRLETRFAYIQEMLVRIDDKLDDKADKAGP